MEGTPVREPGQSLAQPAINKPWDETRWKGSCSVRSHGKSTMEPMVKHGTASNQQAKGWNKVEGVQEEDAARMKYGATSSNQQ
jgi:hypothetical protein